MRCCPGHNSAGAAPPPALPGHPKFLCAVCWGLLVGRAAPAMLCPLLCFQKVPLASPARRAASLHGEWPRQGIVPEAIGVAGSRAAAALLLACGPVLLCPWGSGADCRAVGQQGRTGRRQDSVLLAGPPRGKPAHALPVPRCPPRCPSTGPSRAQHGHLPSVSQHWPRQLSACLRLLGLLGRWVHTRCFHLLSCKSLLLRLCRQTEAISNP